MITLRFHKNGHVEAVGSTALHPEPHLICEGSKEEVLAILSSVYGWRPAYGFRLHSLLRREVVS